MSDVRPLLAALPGLALVSATAGAQQAPAQARHGHRWRRLPGLWRGLHQGDQGGRSDARHRGGQHQGQHGKRAAAGGGQARSRRWSRARWCKASSSAPTGRRPRSRSSPRCMPRPACSSCGPTAAIAASSISRAKPIAWGARGSGLVILGRIVVDGIGLDADEGFRAGLSRARRRRSGDGDRRPGRGPVGRWRPLAGLRRRRQQRSAAPASSCPPPARSTASWPSMASCGA